MCSAASDGSRDGGTDASDAEGSEGAPGDAGLVDSAADPPATDGGMGNDGAAHDDEDCEGGLTTCYIDEDGDGFAPNGAVASTMCGCEPGWTDVEPSPGSVDCSDSAPTVYPDAPEVCNDLSDDCDAVIDEGASATCVFENAAGVCDRGECQLAECSASHDDCDMDTSNGCETPMDTIMDCGACGRSCDVDYGACGESGCSCPAPTYGDGEHCVGPGPLSGITDQLCALGADAEPTCWGTNATGPLAPPAMAFRQISLAHNHACGVLFDGGIHCWGDDDAGETSPPQQGTFVQVAAGVSHSCALDAEGKVHCWGVSQSDPGGEDDHGQSLAPDGDFRFVAASGDYACAIRLDGTVACWGYGSNPDGACEHISENDCGQAIPPTGTFVQLALSPTHACALTPGGTVICWGAGTTRSSEDVSVNQGQAIAPPGSFTSIAVGSLHTCALNDIGSATCWGAGDGESTGFDQGQATPRASARYLQLAGGRFHTCGITTALDLECWGFPENADIPTTAAGPFPLVPTAP